MSAYIYFLEHQCQALNFPNFKLASEYDQDFLDKIVELYTENQITTDDVYAFCDTSVDADGSFGIIFSDHGLVARSVHGTEVISYDSIRFVNNDGDFISVELEDQEEDEDPIFIINCSDIPSADDFAWYIRALRVKYILEEGSSSDLVPPFEECFEDLELVGLNKVSDVPLAEVEKTLDEFDSEQIDINDIYAIRTLRVSQNNLENALIFTSKGMYFICGDESGLITYKEFTDVYPGNDEDTGIELVYCEVNVEDNGNNRPEWYQVADLDDPETTENFAAWLNDIVYAAILRKDQLTLEFK